MAVDTRLVQLFFFNWWGKLYIPLLKIRRLAVVYVCGACVFIKASSLFFKREYKYVLRRSYCYNLRYVVSLLIISFVL